MNAKPKWIQFFLVSLLVGLLLSCVWPAVGVGAILIVACQFSLTSAGSRIFWSSWAVSLLVLLGSQLVLSPTLSLSAVAALGVLPVSAVRHWMDSKVVSENRNAADTTPSVSPGHSRATSIEPLTQVVDDPMGETDTWNESDGGDPASKFHSLPRDDHSQRTHAGQRIRRASADHRSLLKEKLDQVVSKLWLNPLFSPEQLDAVGREVHDALADEKTGNDFATIEWSESSAPIQVECLQRNQAFGSYRIERLLERGGTGNVYLARSGGQEWVALKVLHSARFAKRFEREIELLQQLAHPNIVVAYEAGEHRGTSYLAMEYLPGRNLHQHVRDRGPMQWQEAVDVIYQASLGLAHAHQRGLVHRDIKPGNLMWDGNGRVKVADLGLAFLVNANEDSGESQVSSVDESDGEKEFSTKIETVGGTPDFMAPEQARSLKLADAKSDLFALGASWYFLMVGKSRNPGETHLEKLSCLADNRLDPLPDGICPPAVASIWQHMVNHDPEHRFQTVDELLTALTPHLSKEAATGADLRFKILVVEDNDDDLFVTLETLRRGNRVLETVTADSLAEALDAISKYAQFDAILLDLNLSDSRGGATVAGVRAAAPECPIIVLTGDDDLRVGRLCIEAGADDYLCKSDLTASQLERAIFITQSRVSRRQIAE